MWSWVLDKSNASSIIAKQQLLCISNNQTTEALAADYELTANVTFASNPFNEDWNNDGVSDGELGEYVSEGWLSLWIYDAFMGSFDGGNHIIKNLYIHDKEWRAYMGFLGDIRSTEGEIKNLTLEDVNILGRTHPKIMIIGRTFNGANSAGILNYEFIEFEENVPIVTQFYYQNVTAIFFNNFSGGTRRTDTLASL